MNIHIDFETRSTADLKKTGAHKYAEDPNTEVWCMAYAVDDGPIEIWKPGDKWPRFDMSATFVAHNMQFELQIWNKIMNRRFDWPIIRPSQSRCTMAMCYALGLPGALEQAAAAVGLDVRKDMEGRRLMLQMSRPRKILEDGKIIWWDDPQKIDRLSAYCMVDVEVERQLETRLVRLMGSEQKLWETDQQINERGIQIDIEAVHKAIEIVNESKKRLDAEMNRVTGGWVTKCTKVADLVEYLELKGVETSGVAKADVAALLERDDLPPEVRKALELRADAAKSSTAKLQAMLNAASEDGRTRGVMQYHGASTGRWAGRRIQPQNFPRPDIPQDEIEEIVELISHG